MEEEESKHESTGMEKKDDSVSREEASWWGTWGQGWIETVKEKSAVTLEMVKKDLNEFVEVIQGDTSTAMSDTATKLESKEASSKGSEDNSAAKVMKQGLSTFLHSVSELIAISPDDSKDEFITLSDDKFSLQSYNRKQEKLHAIQIDPGTYCNEPEGLFGEWLEIFDLNDEKSEMSNLLIQKPAIRAIYTQLVPTVVSHTTFWQRYFYQVFLFEAEEKKHEELIARASSTKDDTDGGWDDEDDDDIEVLSKQPVSEDNSKTLVVEHDNEQLTLNIDIVPIKTQCEEDYVEYTLRHEESIGDKLKKEEQSDDKLRSKEHMENNNLRDEEHVSNKLSSLSADTVTKHCLDNENEKNIDKKFENKNKKLDDCEKRSETDVLKSLTKTDSLMESDFLTSNSDSNVLNSTTRDISCDTIRVDDNSWGEDEACHSNGSKPSHIQQEYSETSSLNSWISIDDDLKVKKIKGEHEIMSSAKDLETNSKSSSDSSAIIVVNKSDADDEDDEDFDLDLDEDVNDEELAKMVEEIKNKSSTEDGDDDWENWE